MTLEVMTNLFPDQETKIGGVSVTQIRDKVVNLNVFFKNGFSNRK